MVVYLIGLKSDEIRHQAPGTQAPKKEENNKFWKKIKRNQCSSTLWSSVSVCRPQMLSHPAVAVRPLISRRHLRGSCYINAAGGTIDKRRQWQGSMTKTTSSFFYCSISLRLILCCWCRGRIYYGRISFFFFSFLLRRGRGIGTGKMIKTEACNFVMVLKERLQFDNRGQPGTLKLQNMWHIAVNTTTKHVVKQAS